MTKKQLEILNYFRKYRLKNKVSPSLPELAKHYKKAISTIWERLHSLVRQGYLVRTKDYVRGYELSLKKYDKSIDWRDKAKLLGFNLSHDDEAWNGVEIHLRIFGHLPNQKCSRYYCEKVREGSYLKVEEFLNKLVNL